MAATIISGKDVSCQIREELKGRAARLKEKGHVPGLAVVLVGEDPASVSYVTAKAKAAEEIGIFETTIRMAAGLVRGGDPPPGRQPQPGRAVQRLPRPAALAEVRQLREGHQPHLPGQGRRRLPPRQRRQDAARASPVRCRARPTASSSSSSGAATARTASTSSSAAGATSSASRWPPCSSRSGRGPTPR